MSMNLLFNVESLLMKLLKMNLYTTESKGLKPKLGSLLAPRSSDKQIPSHTNLCIVGAAPRIAMFIVKGFRRNDVHNSRWACLGRPPTQRSDPTNRSNR